MCPPPRQIFANAICDALRGIEAQEARRSMTPLQRAATDKKPRIWRADGRWYCALPPPHHPWVALGASPAQAWWAAMRYGKHVGFDRVAA